MAHDDGLCDAGFDAKSKSQGIGETVCDRLFMIECSYSSECEQKAASSGIGHTYRYYFGISLQATSLFQLQLDKHSIYSLLYDVKTSFWG